MPELPEVEGVRRSLQRSLAGFRVETAVLFRADFACAPPRRSRPTPTELLSGAVFHEFVRRGKQIAIVAADGRVLNLHLGMSGHPSVSHLSSRPVTTPRARARREHLHVEWLLSPPASGAPDDYRVLQLRDPRRFGGVWCFPSFAALIEHRWSQLGPDALTISPEQLAPPLSESPRAIKAALLDQAVLAGVGNIYADEALFHSRISPLRPCKSLSASDFQNLAAAVRHILGRAVEAGGSTIRDFADAAGSSGTYQQNHLVYGRAGQCCPACTKPLSQVSIAQRTTVFCTICQR